MNTYSLIENWLSQTALAENVANSPDADGLWRLPYGRITLSLGVPEQADSFILYVPLMSVTGADETARAAFYQYLLHLQLKGTLPMGMTFGMDLDDTLVGMVGQFAVAGMDMRSFDNLLSEVASSADALYEQLQSHFEDLLHSDAPAERQEESLPSPAVSQLSNEELLRIRMMQSIYL